MIATLAAIRIVLAIFIALARDDSGAASAASSTRGGGGIVEAIVAGGVAGGIGGSEGGGAGAWAWGTAGNSVAAFLKGHFNHLGSLLPVGFGPFTGVSA